MLLTLVSHMRQTSIEQIQTWSSSLKTIRTPFQALTQRRFPLEVDSNLDPSPLWHHQGSLRVRVNQGCATDNGTLSFGLKSCSQSPREMSKSPFCYSCLFIFRPLKDFLRVGMFKDVSKLFKTSSQDLLGWRVCLTRRFKFYYKNTTAQREVQSNNEYDDQPSYISIQVRTGAQVFRLSRLKQKLDD